MTTKSKRHENALDRIADFMVEDILKTKPSDIIAETVDDHGDGQALAVQFDKLTRPLLQNRENIVQSAPQRQHPTAGLTDRLTSQVNDLIQTIASVFFPGHLKLAISSLAILLAAAAAFFVIEGPAFRGKEQFASKTANAGYMAVVASGDDRQDALSKYQLLQKEFPSLLGERQPILTQDSKSTTRYTAAVGPFATQREANSLCERVNKSASQCFVDEYPRK